MEKISQYTFKDMDVNLMIRNGKIAYTFEKDGKTFGHAVTPESRSMHDVASATFLLLLNFVETLEVVSLLKD